MTTTLDTIGKAASRLDELSPVDKATQVMREWVSRHPGERLPSEVALANELCVSRNTLRTVLKQLEAQDLIQCLGRREGRVVASQQNKPSKNGLMSRTVVLISPWEGDLEKPVQEGMLEAIEAGAIAQIRQQGRCCLLMHQSDLEDDGFPLQDFHPYGVIGIRNFDSRIVRRFQDAGIPIVIYGSTEQVDEVDQIVSDHRKGCYQLTKHLIACGRKRIQRIWTPSQDLWWLQQRNQGYEDAINEAGLPCLPYIQVPVLSCLTTGRETTHDERLVLCAGSLVECLSRPDPPDAILATTDLDAILVDEAIRMFGKDPKKDILVCGFDNNWQVWGDSKGNSVRPFATVDKMNERVGQELAKMLQHRVENGGPYRQSLIEPKLITF
mgnify:CR=1 FL=1